jgi:hypothetical protein
MKMFGFIIHSIRNLIRDLIEEKNWIFRLKLTEIASIEELRMKV